MKKYNKLLKILLALCTLSYPFVIYFLLKNKCSFSILSIILIFVVLLNFSKIKNYIILTLGLALSFLLYYTNNQIYIKIYPVIMNLGVCACFFASLNKKPLITYFAEKMGHTVTDEVFNYTKKATIYWGVFMALNAVASFITVFASDFIWAIYNGFISYILIGLMFVVEIFIRRKYVHDR
ncbi:MAG: hypothetical protein ACOX3T_02365 [Bdellovibrionota bacterium]